MAADPSRRVEALPKARSAATQPASLFDRACHALEADCVSVLESAAANFRLGRYSLPMAVLGLFYFTALFWWFALIGAVSRSRAWLQVVISCAVALGLGTSIYMVIAMLRMGAWCPWCLASHVLNLMLFICLLLLWPRTEAAPSAAEDSQAEPLFEGAPAVGHPAAPAAVQESLWPHWWMLAVLPIVVVLSIFVELQSLSAEARALQAAPESVRKELEQAKTLRDYYQKLYSQYESKWQHAFTAWATNFLVNIPTEGRPVRWYIAGGPKGRFSYTPVETRHSLVIFSDFQCPTCREFEHWLQRGVLPIAAQNGGIKIVFKEWPIDRACNADAIRSIHPAACKAALAAEAAYIVGGNEAFWKMHDLLFEKQNEWKIPYEKTATASGKPLEELLMGYAGEIGLDAGRFLAALNGEEAMRRVQADLADARDIGKQLVEVGELTEAGREFLKVDSTPSVYINNRKLPIWRHFNAWKAILTQPVAPGRPAQTQLQE